MAAIFTIGVLVACGLTSLVMLVAAIRYLSFDEARKAALRSEPGQMYGLSKGEDALRLMATLGIAAGLFSMPWWPRKGGGMPILSSDLPGLITWGAVSWLAVAAVLLRRLIYKRWV